MVHSLFNQHCHEVMPPGAFTELDGRMRGYVTQQIQAHLASWLSLAWSLPHSL